MTIHAPCGVIHFGGMVAFFIKNGGDSQNLPGTVGYAKAATLAAVFNNNDLPQPFFPRAVFVLRTYLIFLSFLHRFNTFPCIIRFTQGNLPDGFYLLDYRGFSSEQFPEVPNSIKCAQSCSVGIIRIKRPCQEKTLPAKLVLYQ
jgi:hypothetical protein